MWFLTAHPKLSTTAHRTLLANTGELAIPNIVLFEIEHAYRRGRFPVEALTAARMISAASAVRYVASTRHLLKYYPSDLEMHDAMIVATTLLLQARHPGEEVALLTADRAIHDCGLVNVIW